MQVRSFAISMPTVPLVVQAATGVSVPSGREDFAAATAAAHTANATLEPAASGPFQPTWDSLQYYGTHEWFRDAKFGIWAHWGPQCQPYAFRISLLALAQ